MTNHIKKFLDSGTLFVWVCGGAVATSVLLVVGVLVLIMVNGLGYFWPSNLIEYQLTNGKKVLGELKDREVIPNSMSVDTPEGKSRIQLKVGNRDLYGLDFRWVDEDQIVSHRLPDDAIAFERREWGNFYGYLGEVIQGDAVLASGGNEGWNALGPLLDRGNALHEEITNVEKDEIGDINYEIEKARLRIRALESQDNQDSTEMADLRASIKTLEHQYEKHVRELEVLRAKLNEYSIVVVDANGEQKKISSGQILAAIRPNNMGVLDKTFTYIANVWKVLSEEPREANTEGGIFPAIFGTVMMVLIMSVAVVPFGVLAAFYLREYARQGSITRAVRIAVNNLAGVPSIVFGVFGLGFFVYAVGGTIDNLFYAEALPNPTFGTGGIFWASLTLALMTVPVVIVSTEEGLSAVPREYREGSLALGATKFETMWRVILPSALPGILTGLILAIARATGEVAPLMLTGVVKLAPALPVDGHFPFVHLDRKFMHLGFHIYDVGFQSPNVEAAKPMVYVTTLVLVVVVVCLNITAVAVRNYMRKKSRGAAV